MVREKMSSWWTSKSKINVVVDNDSWIIPYAHDLVRKISAIGYTCTFHSKIATLEDSDVTFFLGCVNLVPSEYLALSKRNLVVHESDLPKGKGFAPIAWQILEGKNEIPVRLLGINDGIDAGPIYMADSIQLDGTELNDRIRAKQGEKTVDICLSYLTSEKEPLAQSQTGQETFYPKRTPQDSELALSSTLEELFNKLRIVDNERYPAFFYINGKKYILSIRESSDEKNSRYL